MTSLAAVHLLLHDFLNNICTKNRQQPFSPCPSHADTQAHVLIGWHLGAHTHSHVDTRPALGAAAWPLDLCAQCVTVIVMGESGVVCALQNPRGSAQRKRMPWQDALPIHAARNDGVCPIDMARCESLKVS